MSNDTLKTKRVCRPNKLSATALQPWLTSALNSKLAFARKLKRRFAPRNKNNDTRTSLNAAGLNTSELSRKKLQEPPRNLNFLLKSNDLKLKSLRQHQLMHQDRKS